MMVRRVDPMKPGEGVYWNPPEDWREGERCPDCGHTSWEHNMWIDSGEGFCEADPGDCLCTRTPGDWETSGATAENSDTGGGQ